MVLNIEASGQICGAVVRGVDLSVPMTAEVLGEVRAAWLKHRVIAFPDQDLSLDALQALAPQFGDFGEDPFIAGLPTHPHVIEVKREANETAPVFAEGWHSDWSFLPVPPSGTLLYGCIIPAVGGDTLFADQYAAYDALDNDMKVRLQSLMGVHSARRGYSPQGFYGTKDVGRSMAIRYSDSAMATQLHPVVSIHGETGRPVLFVNPGYTIGIDGFSDQSATELLSELFVHQVKPEFIYRHQWAEGMLTLWDNRCLLHSATGGYQGHRRLLHRVTVAPRR